MTKYQRRKLGKQRRRGRNAGIAFEGHSPASTPDVEKIFARMLAVEWASRKGAESSGIIEPEPRKFYAVMLKRLALSWGARVIFARHQDRGIGFIFGGMERDIYRGQQFSFDDAWRTHSIGNLLQLEQIRWLCEEKASRYDMGPLLGKGMEYKHNWTEQLFHIESWVVVKN